MGIKALKPDVNQTYSNLLKDRNIYPFNENGRVLVNKDTGEILKKLHPLNSGYDIDGNPYYFDIDKHDIMVKYVPIYMRRTWNGRKVSDSVLHMIPKTKIYKDYEVPKCFIDANGNIRDYILIGAFPGVEINGQLRSIPGNTPTINKSITDFKTLASNGRNSEYSIVDIESITMVQNLYKIIFANTNSQITIGDGHTNVEYIDTTGSTMYTGNQSGYGIIWNNEGDLPNEKIIGIMGLNKDTSRLDWWFKNGGEPIGAKSIVNPGDNGVFYDENAIEVI